MATKWLSWFVTPLINRAAREIVARLGQPTFLLGPGWRVIFANAEAKDAFALDPDHTIGQRIFDLDGGGWDVPTLHALLEREFAGREALTHLRFEHVFPRVGFRVFQLTLIRLRGAWFDTGLTVLAFQDETDRTRAETRLTALLEGAPDAMVVVDEAGTLQLVNRQAIALFGYAREDLLSQPVELLVPDAVRGRHPAHRANYLIEPQRRPMGADLELTARRRDGSEFPVDIALSPVQTDDGLLIVAAVRDITERRIAERERADLELQLRDAQKLESIGRLAGGVAHDFNNLLTVIQGYAAIALASLPPDASERHGVEQIHGAAERGAALTAQLLAFSRRQVMQPVGIDLNAIVEGLAPMLNRLLGDDIEFATALEPLVDTVRADPGQIGQVIMNLALNARDAMPNGGRLMIETANVELDEDYVRHHPEATVGAHVLLAVSDSGSGIDPQVLGHVFEPFFTTKGPGRGTGLGLATVYGIVRQSGGSVRVYSEPGRGSTFRVYLPSVEGAPDRLLTREMAPLVGGSESILVAEDDDRVRALLRNILERYGYRVMLAASGEEALKAAEDGPPFDLLVTDLIMPGINGRELADRLVAMHPTLHVLYLSGYAENAIGHQGMLNAGVHFLAKPFSPETLVRRIRGILGGSGEG